MVFKDHLFRPLSWCLNSLPLLSSGQLWLTYTYTPLSRRNSLKRRRCSFWHLRGARNSALPQVAVLSNRHGCCPQELSWCKYIASGVNSPRHSRWTCHLIRFLIGTGYYAHVRAEGPRPVSVSLTPSGLVEPGVPFFFVCSLQCWVFRHNPIENRLT